MTCGAAGPGYDDTKIRPWNGAATGGVPVRAVTKRHGAVKVQFLCAQRGAGVLLNISAKFWRISSPDRRVTAQVAERAPLSWNDDRYDLPLAPAADVERDAADAKRSAAPAAS